MKTSIKLTAQELENLKKELLAIETELEKIDEKIMVLDKLDSNPVENYFGDLIDEPYDEEIDSFYERRHELTRRIKYIEGLLQVNQNPKSIARYERDKFDVRFNKLKNEKNPFFKKKNTERLREKYLKVLKSMPEELSKSEEDRSPIFRNAIKCLNDLGIDNYEIEYLMNHIDEAKETKNIMF